MKMTMNSVVLYILIVAAQLIFTNYIHLSQFVILTVLPALILCLPMSLSAISCMAIAFVTGISVDLLAEGVVGMNTFALVPVAFMRNQFVAWFMGKDVVVRKADFSFRKNGAGKVSLAMFASLILFLILFIIADGAGTRTFWFNTARLVASTLCSGILCFITVNLMNTERR